METDNRAASAHDIKLGMRWLLSYRKHEDGRYFP